MIYELPGSPIPLLKCRELQKRRQWDDQQHIKTSLSLMLERQHGERPLYQGALHAEFSFFFEFPQRVSPKKLLMERGRAHVLKPALSELIQFIEWIGYGVIFSHDYLICSACVRKCYDDKPRTEFSIKRMD